MEYIHHEVVIAGMGLAALASAARMYELGIRVTRIFFFGKLRLLLNSMKAMDSKLPVI